jgi:hypothetical protein
MCRQANEKRIYVVAPLEARENEDEQLVITSTLRRQSLLIVFRGAIG